VTTGFCTSRLSATSSRVVLVPFVLAVDEVVVDDVALGALDTPGPPGLLSWVQPASAANIATAPARGKVVEINFMAFSPIGTTVRPLTGLQLMLEPLSREVEVQVVCQ
jgi:hypothetical protein